jgi:CRP-like cAMP-binding protein
MTAPPSKRNARTLLSPLLVVVLLGAVYLWRASLISAVPAEDVESVRRFAEGAMSFMARHMEPLEWSAGDEIIREGERGQSMFFIVEGMLEVFAQSDGRRCRLAAIGPGEFIGEMSLLTGEPRSATVVAATDGIGYEVTKDHVGDLLIERPEIAGLMSTIIAERRVRDERANEAFAAEVAVETTEGLAGQILRRIRAFFTGP